MEDKRVLTNGKTEAEMPDYRETTASGQQKAYVVLSEAERAKGFVQPVRQTYTHEKCNSNTTMGLAIAETYARDPKFYGATFCSTCGNHFPVGENGEFVWAGTAQKVGTVRPVQTEDPIRQAELKKREAFAQAANPLIKWLNDNVHPHHHVIVDATGAELVEGVMAHRTDEFLKD